MSIMKSIPNLISYLIKIPRFLFHFYLFPARETDFRVYFIGKTDARWAHLSLARSTRAAPRLASWGGTWRRLAPGVGIKPQSPTGRVVPTPSPSTPRRCTPAPTPPKLPTEAELCCVATPSSGRRHPLCAVAIAAPSAEVVLRRLLRSGAPCRRSSELDHLPECRPSCSRFELPRRLHR
jgi:hypothetical protein